jgi:RecA-family ATPase
MAALRNGVKHKTDTSPYGGGLEVYDRERFFCVTGWHLSDTPDRIVPFDPTPIVNAIKGNGKKELSTSSFEGSRHDHLVREIWEMRRLGLPREAAEEFVRAISRDIGLPKRESDEVGRIIDWAYSEQSVISRINREVDQLEIKHQARREFEKRRMPEALANVDDVMDSAELMALPDKELLHTVDPIWPAGSNVLIVAERKAGKTTMVLNLFKSLLDGEPFLGSMPVSPPKNGTILYMNYEMIEDSIKNWLKKQNIRNKEDLLFWQLKGKRLNLWEDDVAIAVADMCKEQNVWCIVIDTQILSMRGLVQDENASMEVADYQAVLDQLKVISGVQSIVCVHHKSKDGKGSRGSGRIEDWPDAIWTLDKEKDGTRTLDLEMIRYYDSRDALPDKLMLTFDRDHDRLRWDGESKFEHRAEEKNRQTLQAMVRWQETMERWPTRSEMRTKPIIPGDNADKTDVIDSLESQKLIEEVPVVVPGKRGRTAMRMVVTDEGRNVANR